jgi:hypothetical protein
MTGLSSESIFPRQFRKIGLGGLSAATANIPSHHPQAEKVLIERSRLFPCCNLTGKRKRTRPCSDCLASSLHLILRIAQTVVCSHWTTMSRALKPRFGNLQFSVAFGISAMHSRSEKSLIPRSPQVEIKTSPAKRRGTPCPDQPAQLSRIGETGTVPSIQFAQNASLRLPRVALKPNYDGRKANTAVKAWTWAGCCTWTSGCGDVSGFPNQSVQN